MKSTIITVLRYIARIARALIRILGGGRRRGRSTSESSEDVGADISVNAGGVSDDDGNTADAQ